MADLTEMYHAGDVVFVHGLGRQAILHVHADPEAGVELFLKNGRVVEAANVPVVSVHRPYPHTAQAQQLADAGWEVANQQPPTVDSRPIEVGNTLVFLRANLEQTGPAFLLDTFWLYGGLWEHAQAAFDAALTPAMAASVASRLRHEHITEKIRARLRRLAQRNGSVHTAEQRRLEQALLDHETKFQ